MNKISIKPKFLYFLILFLPFLINISYLFFTSIQNDQKIRISDKFTYQIYLKYRFPYIPKDSILEYSNLSFLGSEFWNSHQGDRLRFGEVDFSSFPETTRNKIFVEPIFTINFSTNQCITIPIEELNRIQSKISGAGYLSETRGYPGYSYNFFKIVIGHTEAEIRDFIKSNCNLSTDYPYILEYSNDNKYHD